MIHPLVLVAKEAVENYIKEGKIISPSNNLPSEFLQRKSGTFVTIKKEGQLRGCIGTYLPTKENIAKEIIYNAIAASTEDYRFGPVRKEELPYLTFTVYILSEPKNILKRSGGHILNEPEFVKDVLGLDPKKFGIIVRTTPVPYSDMKEVVFNGHFVAKTGLLLPDLEGIDTTEKQILIACQKGGIDPMKEKIFIYRFTVEKYDQ